MTRIERFLQHLDEAASRTDQMASSGYQEQHLRDLITNVGVHTEIFLKTAVLPHLPPKTEFDSCINALKRDGVSKAHRATLHRLREVYNDSKHNRDYNPSLFEFHALLQDVLPVVHSLGVRNVGETNRPERLLYKRVLWLAVWDHYIGGDSEVHIVIPATDGWPPSLDLVYIDMMAWDQVKVLLSDAGSVRPGKEAIPPRYYDEFAAEGDFRDAIAFEGDYRSVVAALAAYERREKLIPDLLRENHAGAMLQAFTLATIDIANQNPRLPPGEAATAISRNAIETYAVPITFRDLGLYAEGFAEMLRQVPHADREVLSGPVWTGAEEFAAAADSAIAKHPSLNILVDQTRTVRLKIR